MLTGLKGDRARQQAPHPLGFSTKIMNAEELMMREERKRDNDRRKIGNKIQLCV